MNVYSNSGDGFMNVNEKGSSFSQGGVYVSDIIVELYRKLYTECRVAEGQRAVL